MRKKFGIRESQFSCRTTDRLKPIKYIVLILLIVIPVLIANAGFHEDFKLPFCQICPAKPLMPLLEGTFDNLALDFSNSITLTMTVLSMVLAGIFLIGMIFKDRFFCIFCPMLALMSFFDKIGFMKFKKKPDACIGCGNCRRVCPVNIKEVHLEKEKEDVLMPECMLCLKCVEACPGDKALSFKFRNKNIFSSSKKYVSKYFKA